MKSDSRHLPEYLLIGATMLVSILGFWDLYFGAEADPKPHHHLHVATAFMWLGLLLYQLRLIDRRKFADHRNAGRIVLFAAPLLVATTAMLSVHSAHAGVVSGEGDFLIVQNVMGTLELGLLIFMAFLLRENRKLHGSFLLSTTILFLGIALFFALISFAPPFRIEGPETFYRFQTASMTGQAICLALGLVFFVKDFRSGWPFMLPGLFFLFNEWLRFSLAEAGLIAPLTELVGSLSQPLTFLGSFAVVFAVLALTGLFGARPRGAPAI